MIIPTAIECLCCSEITEMMNKRSTEEVGCITLHPGFQSVCLNSSFNSIFTILLSIAICGLENPCIQANTLKPRVKSNTPYLVIHPTPSVDLLFIISVISLQQRHSIAVGIIKCTFNIEKQKKINTLELLFTYQSVLRSLGESPSLESLPSSSSLLVTGS